MLEELEEEYNAQKNKATLALPKSGCSDRSVHGNCSGVTWVIAFGGGYLLVLFQIHPYLTVAKCQWIIFSVACLPAGLSGSSPTPYSVLSKHSLSIYWMDSLKKMPHDFSKRHAFPPR